MDWFLYDRALRHERVQPNQIWLKIFEICALGKLSNAAQTKWKPRRGVSLDEVRHKIIVLK